ncbi:MAG: hypothetical protein M5U29_06465 [Anaerolineae bacterium]|nr:hypothetical protein [Anaerolineae bacterium]
MSTAREEILTALRSRERGGTPLPAPWRSRQQFDDLAARFTGDADRSARRGDPRGVSGGGARPTG